MQGGTGGPLAASGGVTDSLQLNHSGGRLSSWQDKAKCPSHLLSFLYQCGAEMEAGSDRSETDCVDGHDSE